MSFALLIEVHNHYVSYVFIHISQLCCVVGLLLFSSCSWDHCHVMLLSLHCYLTIRYLFNRALAGHGATVIFLWWVMNVVHGQFHEWSQIRNFVKRVVKSVNSLLYCCGSSLTLFPWVSDILWLRGKVFDVLVQMKTVRSNNGWYTG
jgi:hypothetical protein